MTVTAHRDDEDLAGSAHISAVYLGLEATRYDEAFSKGDMDAGVDLRPDEARRLAAALIATADLVDAEPGTPAAP